MAPEKRPSYNYLQIDLTAEGYEIVMTREPGGTRIGNEIRSLILKSRF